MNPILAALISFIIPGVGQIFAGDTKKGIIFLVIFIIFAFMARILHAGMIGYGIGLVYRLYTAYDAYQLSQ